MKTPDEIKKGLECCIGDDEGVVCEECAYCGEIRCVSKMADDALAYILQLEMMAKPNEQIRWERDVAIDQLRELGIGFGEKVEAALPKWKNPDGSILCPYCGTTMRMISAWQKSMPDMGGYMWAARGKCPACGSITPEKHGRTAQEANTAAYAAAQWGRVPLPEEPKEG